MYRKLYIKRYQNNNVEMTILRQRHVRDCIEKDTKTTTP